MNKEQLEKDLQKVLKKHGLNIQYISIDNQKISNDFYELNRNIWDSSEYWFEKLEVNKINWLLSDYGKSDIQLDFNIGDHKLIHEAVLDILYDQPEITDEIVETKFGDFEETTLNDLKMFLSEKVFDQILDKIIESISDEDWFSTIEEHLKDWFDIGYPDETFNEMEALAYWTIYFQPRIEDEDLAWRLGLIPFHFDGEFYLALGGCGMDLSPKLDAYQALTDGTIPSDSRFRDDHNYAKYVIHGEEIFNEVIEAVKCDPLIHIQTEIKTD